MVVHQGDMHKAAQNAVNLYLHMMSKHLFIGRVTECDQHPKLHLVDLVIHFLNHLRLEQFIVLLFNLFPSLILAEISHSTRPAAKLHVDRNNSGDSLAIAFGDYDGGRLWVFDPEACDTYK